MRETIIFEGFMPTDKKTLAGKLKTVSGHVVIKENGRIYDGNRCIGLWSGSSMFEIFHDETAFMQEVRKFARVLATGKL